MSTSNVSPAGTNDPGYIVIDIYQFDISLPYHAGHVLTATEASVLNWHRAELIQKIGYRWLNQVKATHPDDPLLTPDEISVLQSRLSYLDRTYQLAPRKPPRRSFLDRELTNVAIHYLKQHGVPIPSSAQVHQAKQLPEIQALTRKLILARFEDIIINDDSDAP